MKRKIKGISVLFVAIIILALAVEANAIGMSRSAEEIVIGLKENSYIKLKELITLNNGEVVKTISTSKEILAIVAKMPFNLILAFTEKAKTAGARYVEPNFRVQPELLPNDPYWSYQWGPQKIEADWAWNTTVGTHDVLLAVVDSGIDYNHPDLSANYVPLGYDWAYSDTDPMDDYGHGTKVAGVVAAVTNNGIGIAGMAQVKVMAEKVFDKNGEGYVSWVAAAIYHATDQGAKIINLSLSTEYNGSLLYDAVKYAYDSDVLLVAAAGNYANDTKRYPAAYNEVIAVSSTNESDQKAPWSNYGDWVELAAPGGDIFTTALFYEALPFPYNYYRWGSGTSFACPHVSGVAALAWSQFPNASRDWIRTQLRDTADDLGDPGFDEYYGYGRINARKAVNETFPAINYTLTITATAGGTTNPSPGVYTYTAGSSMQVTAIPNTDYTLDYWELDGINIGTANPLNLIIEANYTLKAVFRLSVFDIAVTKIILSKTVVGQGYSLRINVTVANQGDFAETFNVTVYANTTGIETREISLTSGNSTILTFIWNTTGFAYGNYTIWAYVPPVPDETEIDDNLLIDGVVKVTIPGDVDGDFNVNIYDVVKICVAYGSKKGEPAYISNSDINGDGVIDIYDVVIACSNYGKKE